jgi:DnaK suppressor protein
MDKINGMMIELDELETLKYQLSQQRDMLKTRLEQDSLTDISDKNEGDDVDRANQEENKQQLLNRRKHDIQQLRQLNLALARIETDDFGYCEHCGDTINKARLKARPESRLCVECQQNSEIKLRQSGQ